MSTQGKIHSRIVNPLKKDVAQQQLNVESSQQKQQVVVVLLRARSDRRRGAADVLFLVLSPTDINGRAHRQQTRLMPASHDTHTLDYP